MHVLPLSTIASDAVRREFTLLNGLGNLPLCLQNDGALHIYWTSSQIMQSGRFQGSLLVIIPCSLLLGVPFVVDEELCLDPL